jgi:hypothetical protein
MEVASALLFIRGMPEDSEMSKDIEAKIAEFLRRRSQEGRA